MPTFRIGGRRGSPRGRARSDAHVADDDGRAARSEEHADRTRRRRLRRGALLALFVSLFLASMAGALFGQYGYLDVRESRREAERLREEVERRVSVVRELRRDVSRLRDEAARSERVAREDLGWTGEDEVLFLLPPDATDADSAAGDGSR